MSPIVTVHVASVSPLAVPRILRAKVSAPGVIYADTTVGADLSPKVLPKPAPGRVGLVGVWTDDAAFDAFLADDPLAARLAGGWHVRLEPLRTVGSSAGIPELVPAGERPVDPEEPVVVLTYGHTRLRGLHRFLPASAKAEATILGAPGLLASTGFARPPRIVSTFSVWRSARAMRAAVEGGSGPGHVDAVRGNAERGYHHDALFARFRPYATAGEWDGRDPLEGLLRPAGVSRAPVPS